ncbi:hypothetical protein PINS_up009314 [Pythium insidiosum]|nr:hypothetical protein PINS_up009314 [Pythium insidiosum]
MDDRRESMRARHAAELEEKRRKLEEIRRRKAIVRDGASDASTSASAGAAVPDSVARAIGEQENRFDDFIQNILKSSTAAIPVAEAVDAPSSSTDASSGAAASASVTPSAGLSLAEKLAALSTVTNVAEIHIQPTLVETYTKHTETDITLEHEIIVRDRPSETSMMEVDSEARSPQKKQRETASSATTATAVGGDSADSGDTTGDVPMGLSDEEKKKIMQSESLEEFILKASRVIERALTTSSKYDIMIDYGATVEDDQLPDDVAQTLKPLFTFKDEQWTRYRAVTDVDVSPFYPELLLVSYTARDFLEEEERELGPRNASNAALSASSSSALLADLSRTTDGVVLLWSTALPTRPEYRFTCHSQVTSACFNPFDRNLIFGGTYSGQIVVWDTRAKSAPVQKTSLSSGSHTHPVYSLAVVGSKSSYHLVSASTDGRVCVWDVDQLQQPLEMLDLRIAVSIVSNYSSVNIATDKKMEAAVTTFAIHRKENKQLYIGTEAGKLYATPLDPQKSKTTGPIGDAVGMTLDSHAEKTPRGLTLSGFGSSASGVNVGNVAAREIVVDAFSKENAHFGPITAMHLNPLLPVHRDGLLLTASLDSTVKLWSTEHPHIPLYSFEPSNDYVCDVRWSPLHPALFAVVDADGMISFWNICKDVEVPALEVKISEKALNRLRWTSDGKSVIIGDASGHTIVYEVPSEIALPAPDDLSQLESKVGSAILAVGMNRA